MATSLIDNRSAAAITELSTDPNGQIAIDLHQFGDTKPISGCDVFGEQIARGEVTQEPDFSVVAEPSPE